MGNDLSAWLRIVTPYTGIAGIALVLFYYLFRDVIRKRIFPRLNKEQAYQLLLFFLSVVFFLTFSTIILGTSKDLAQGYRFTIIVIISLLLFLSIAGGGWVYLSRGKYTVPQNPNEKKANTNTESPSAIKGEVLINVGDVLQKYAFVDYEKLFGIDEFLADIKGHLLAKDGGWIISLFGEGGIGKTALAQEVCRQYAVQGGFTRFAWVSSKKRYYSLSGELHKYSDTKSRWAELVRTLAEQLKIEIGFTQDEWLGDFQRGIRQLPSNERCLIVIDNLETVQDTDVVDYLDDPYHKNDGIIRPHKVIITTRNSVLSASDSVVEIPLRGLKPHSAYKFIRYLSKGNLEIQQASNNDLKPILDITEGNPLLIRLAVKKVLISRTPLRIALDEFKKEAGVLKDYLYKRSLDVLDSKFDETITDRLMSSFCPSPPGEILTYEQVYRYSGIIDKQLFRRALKTACDLALIRYSFKENNLNEAKYSIHSLLWEYICGDIDSDEK